MEKLLNVALIFRETRIDRFNTSLAYCGFPRARRPKIVSPSPEGMMIPASPLPWPDSESSARQDPPTSNWEREPPDR